MTIKSVDATLPPKQFLRISKSNIVNRERIDSFDSNDVYIGEAQIAIGMAYRDAVLASLLK